MRSIPAVMVIAFFLFSGLSRAEMIVDFGGQVIEELGGGKVGMALEIRSDQPLWAVRIEADRTFPLELDGAKLPDKISWRVHRVDQNTIRLAPQHSGKPLGALDLHLLLKPKRGRSTDTIFGSGARDLRPSFWVIGTNKAGDKEKVEVFLPYISREE